MRKCIFCQAEFVPKSPKRLFCCTAHRDFYNKGKDWSSYYKNLLLHSKSDRGELDAAFLVEMHENQGGRCALSGVELTKITGQKSVPTNASLDRIRPGEPYTRDNVRLLCTFVNSFRGNLSDEALVWWCGEIVKQGTSMAERNRDYKKEYNDYHATPAQKKRRAARNSARDIMEKKGKVKKGDGKDVDHINRNPNGNLGNSPSNLRVVRKSINRSRNSHKK
jgi:hypothetical protein